jgi:D-glycero-D-manno-heptose 1,7-bisphosphate phosphatase
MSRHRKLIVLDRDGVINAESAAYIKTPEEWQPLPGSLEAIARLCDSGYEVFVVTNQSGIGRGLFAATALEAIHAKMLDALDGVGGRLAGIYHCPHAPLEGCGCRKPRTGMLEQLKAEHDIDSFAGVPFIGDKASDLSLAARVGGRGILVLSGAGRETAGSSAGAETYADLAAAVDAVLAEGSC